MKASSTSKITVKGYASIGKARSRGGSGLVLLATVEEGFIIPDMKLTIEVADGITIEIVVHTLEMDGRTITSASKGDQIGIGLRKMTAEDYVQAVQSAEANKVEKRPPAHEFIAKLIEAMTYHNSDHPTLQEMKVLAMEDFDVFYGLCLVLRHGHVPPEGFEQCKQPLINLCLQYNGSENIAKLTALVADANGWIDELYVVATGHQALGNLKEAIEALRSEPVSDHEGCLTPDEGQPAVSTDEGEPYWVRGDEHV